MSPTPDRRPGSWRLGLAAFCLACLAAGESRAQIRVDPPVPGIRPSLTPDRIPSFPRRPFEWGRRDEFHTRKGWNAGSLPAYNYDRQIPVAGATAFSFDPIVETLSISPLSQAASRGPSLPPKGLGDPMALATNLPATALPVARKRFQMRANQIVADSFVLRQMRVSALEEGGLDASAEVFHTGGPTGTDRGGRALLRVRGYSAARGLPFDGDGVVLWETTQTVWIARGGPTVVDLLGPEARFVYRARIASTFDELTHVAVTIEPLTIR
jgi:hypothetical protein